MTKQPTANDRPNRYLDPDTLSCPICDGKDFTWGDARTGNHEMRFDTGDRSLFHFGELILARKCNRCGNVQLFVED